MGHMDVRRRGESLRNSRKPAGLWHDVRYNPYFSILAGLGAAIPASWFSVMFLQGNAFSMAAGMTIPTLALVGRGIYQFGRQSPDEPRSEIGGEKQLLVALASKGGGITCNHGVGQG